MSLDLPRIRALCFDVDGTLSDTDDYYVARLSSYLRRLPFLHKPEQAARRLAMWVESPGNFVMGLADRMHVDDQLVGVMNWLFRHARQRPGLLPSIPGVRPLLDDLRHRYPMAVVSARNERTTLAYLEHAGLRSHFQVIVTALSARRTKPFPDPVLLAARELGVSPGSCLMIGDTTVDIRAGRAAGAQTVGVLCGFGEQDELRRNGADLILPSTADLGRVLLGQ
ncbi:MAG: HAD family hydrolase [Chloroflexota bacterium]